MATVAELRFNVLASTGKFNATMSGVAKTIQKTGRSIAGLGQDLTKITLPLAAFGAFSFKAAVDFENAFAGVKKTIKALPEEFKALENGILELSKRIPIAATELSRIGEAAGQLGIKKENILSFIEVMANLGVATNLSSNEAASALARLANITQMPQENFDRLGSTVVALGNSLETTEKEIIDMALNLAGTGAQIGLTEDQILAMSAALSSVGIAAEKGGTAFSKLFIRLKDVVTEGGAELERFAQTAQLPAAEFKRLFEKDAAGAIDVFIQGLGKSADALTELKELGGFTEVRIRDSLLRMAGASSGFSDALKVGKDAWAENNALTIEAAERYKTFSSQLTLTKNNLFILAKGIGDELMPSLTSLLKILGSGIDVFKSATSENRRLKVELAAIVVVAGPLLIALGKILVVFGLLNPPVLAFIATLVSLRLAWEKWGADFIRGIEIIKRDWTKFFTVGLPGALNLFSKLYFDFWRKIRDDAIDLAKQTVIGVKDWLVEKFQQNVVEPIKKKLEMITGFFREMYMAVVGGSIVPDMVNETIQEFYRMNVEVVREVEEMTKKGTEQFEDFSEEFKNLSRDLAQTGFSFDGLLGALDNLAISVSSKLSEALNAGMLGEAFSSGIGNIIGSGMIGTIVNAIQEGIGLLISDPGAFFEGDSSFTGFNGPAVIRDAIDKIGETLFGDKKDSDQIDREAIRDAINNALDAAGGVLLSGGVRLSEIDLGGESEFTTVGFAERFKDAAGDVFGVFDTLGKALADLAGVSAEVGGQIGYILFNNIGGNLNDARLLVQALGLDIGALEETMIQAGLSGEKSWHEVEVALQHLNQLSGDGLVEVGNFRGAFEQLINSGGRGAQAIQAVRNIAIEAMEAGANTLEDLQRQMQESGQFTAREIEILFKALSQRGITTLDQLKNASDRNIGGVVADIESLGFTFKGIEKGGLSATKTIEGLDDAWSQVPTDHRTRYVIDVDLVGDPIPNAFTGNKNRLGGIINASGTEFLARGGIVSRATLVGFRRGLAQIAGEAGPEAIMPLKRINGRLGVETTGGQASTVINVDARGAQLGAGEQIRRELEKLMDTRNRPPGARV